MNTQWLREASNHIIDESEPFLDFAKRRFGVVLVGGFCIIVGRLAFRPVRYGRLMRPEKKGGQAGILFECARRSVARARFCSAENLLQGCAAHYFPNVSQKASLVRLGRFGIPAKRYLVPFGVLHFAIPAVDFHGRTDAREDQVRTTEAFGRQIFYPLANSARQLPEHVRPVADLCIVGSWSTNEVNAGSERRRVLRPQPSRALGRHRPRTRDRPATFDHSTQQSFPTLSCLVCKNDTAAN